MNLLPCHCFPETFIARCCIVVVDFLVLDEVLMLQAMLTIPLQNDMKQNIVYT